MIKNIKNNMINSVGFVIVWNNKILLSHPKKQAHNMWGIAKGKIENNETFLECAIRETKEEIGLDIDFNIIPKNIEWKTIIYRNIKNKAYKKLHYTILYIDDLSQIGMDNDSVISDKLSPREIDEARFMDKNEADTKIFWRQREILDVLKEITVDVEIIQEIL